MNIVNLYCSYINTWIKTPEIQKQNKKVEIFQNVAKETNLIKKLT